MPKWSIFFQNDAGSSDTSTTTRSRLKISYKFGEKRLKSRPFIISLSGSVFAEDRKCVLWHLATSSWNISAFWEDTGFITASVPTPSDATSSRTCEPPPGELRQAACAGQKKLIINILPWARLLKTEPNNKYYRISQPVIKFSYIGSVFLPACVFHICIIIHLFPSLQQTSAGQGAELSAVEVELHGSCRKQALSMRSPWNSKNDRETLLIDSLTVKQCLLI